MIASTQSKVLPVSKGIKTTQNQLMVVIQKYLLLTKGIQFGWYND